MKQRIRILSGKGTVGEKSVTPDEVIHLHGERDLSVLHDACQGKSFPLAFEISV
jgi:hypothetical protein